MRDLIVQHLSKAKFQWVDCCGSRAAFKVKKGCWKQFVNIAKEAGKKEGIKLKRILYILDPGLGLVLNYPEDIL